MPRLVEPEELPAAGALTSVQYAAGALAGPIGAGFLIAAWGLTSAYAIDAATFLVSGGALLLIAAKPPPPDAPPVSLAGIRDGLAYARSRPVLLGSYATDMAAMFFGIPEALLPQLAASHGGARTLGLLVAAPAAGGLATALTSGWTARVARRGRAVALAAGAYGLAVAGAASRAASASPSRASPSPGPATTSAASSACGLERDDPGRAARPARRHRDAVVVERADARAPRVGHRGCAPRPAPGDRLGRPPGGRRRGRVRGGPASLLARRRAPRGAGRRGRGALRGEWPTARVGHSPPGSAQMSGPSRTMILTTLSFGSSTAPARLTMMSV